MEFPWRPNSCESHPGEPKSECSCNNIIANYSKINNKHAEFNKIINDGYLYLETELVGKMMIIDKPDFFAGGLHTLGQISITDLKTKDICFFESINP